MILDSNIIIYSVQPSYQQLKKYIQQSQDAIYISLISKLEVLGYHKITPLDKSAFEAFFDSTKILPINDDVANVAIRLRQQRKCSVGDSIIAATALLYDMPLLTNNIEDFAYFSGLKLIPITTIM